TIPCGVSAQRTRSPPRPRSSPSTPHTRPVPSSPWTAAPLNSEPGPGQGRLTTEEEVSVMTVQQPSAVVLRAHRTDLSQPPSSVLAVEMLPQRELTAGQVRVRNLFQQVIAASGD